MMPRRSYRKWDQKCSVEGCKDNAKYSGLCGMHYKRQWRHGDVNTSIIPHEFVPTICEVESCIESTYASNTPYCKKHYLRMYRYGRIHNIRNGYGETEVRYRNTAGYWMIKDEEGNHVYEHVWLAEKALGKRLPKGAVVHHVNENPSDNDTPFNLIICQDQAYHLLLHRRAKSLNT